MTLSFRRNLIGRQPRFKCNVCRPNLFRPNVLRQKDVDPFFSRGLCYKTPKTEDASLAIISAFKGSYKVLETN
jgi:hypothetical protein